MAQPFHILERVGAFCEVELKADPVTPCQSTGARPRYHLAEFTEPRVAFIWMSEMAHRVMPIKKGKFHKAWSV